MERANNLPGKSSNVIGGNTMDGESQYSQLALEFGKSLQLALTAMENFKTQGASNGVGFNEALESIAHQLARYNKAAVRMEANEIIQFSTMYHGATRFLPDRLESLPLAGYCDALSPTIVGSLVPLHRTQNKLETLSNGFQDNAIDANRIAFGNAIIRLCKNDQIGVALHSHAMYTGLIKMANSATSPESKFVMANALRAMMDFDGMEGTNKVFSTPETQTLIRKLKSSQ